MYQRSLTVAALRAGVQQSQPLGKKEDRELLVEKPVGGSVGKLTLAEAISEFGADAKAKLSNSAATGQPEDLLRAPLRWAVLFLWTLARMFLLCSNDYVQLEIRSASRCM
jgi:hypothetical protein